MKSPLSAQTPTTLLKGLGKPPRQWARSEFRLDEVPLQGANPYDPDQIALDATITAPSTARLKIPLFWYVGYARHLEAGDKGEEEKLASTPQTTGEWRLRWTPREKGIHTIVISVKSGLQLENMPTITLQVAPKTRGAHGFVSIEPTRKRYFQMDDGQPLPLFGMNACWPGKRGTYDYDDWLPAMGRNGMNYTRLWQGNAAFHAELYGNERLNYNQPTLWQLDHVFDVAAQNGINIMLCMGFHGEFQTELDMWGNKGWWKTHAYQTQNGGPCEKPNDFFTDPTAAMLYRKRLRYLVARYGANPNLFSWQFFNEINNYYGDANASQSENRDKNRLHPPDVVSWHERMGKYLRALDPYHHLVTTSFGSAGEQKEMWQLPELDYTNYHWYGNWSGPYEGVTQMTGFVGSQLGQHYDKPVVVAEFGTDGRGWAPTQDAERRGLRQALWGSVFCGTAGTAMPWWWENIHQENLYPLWRSLHDFLPADFGCAKWQVLEAVRPPYQYQATLGEHQAAAPRFNERIALTPTWGIANAEPLVINKPGDGDEGRIGGYVQGHAKPQLICPFVIQANLGAHAQLLLHLNSVSNGSIMVVQQNGKKIFERALPNKDGKWEQNNEYNEDIAVPLEAGRATIEISNAGEDWYFLDWIRIDGVLQAEEKPEDPTTIPLEHYLLSDGHTRLLWLVDSRYSWPRAKSQNSTPLEGAQIALSHWPDGDWNVQWWQTREGKELGNTRVTARGGQLSLPVIAFSGDVAARLTPAK